ncbi:hypothetical protein CIB95_06955 [Lottiidibacillus patelloidae]|uniref:Uncharacterized protein n=1 Tax=Lottiidibacillus patelloidae TaxID=2670334 RepID=A0A263BUF2_9BACI|nr:hypothetical protein [Lottiidibacillus patelloidae]OZM57198.1 hypothetical protein CIB95_06955 [Lottiidibacillus patelloidae]
MKILKNIYVIPAIITFVLILLLFVEQVNEKTSFPSEGWSRSISFNEVSDGRTYFISTNENGSFEAYTPADNELLHLTINEDLEVTNKEIIPVELHKRKDFWAKDNDVIYLDEQKNLVLFSNGKNAVISENVNGASFDENTILFWDNKSIYFVDSESYKVTKVAETEKPIKDLLIDKDSKSFVVVFNIDPSVFDIAYYFHDTNVYIPVYSGELVTHLGATLTDLAFVDENEKLHFVYTAITRRQGVRKSKTNYLTVDVRSKEVKTEPLVILDSENNRPLSDPGDFELFSRNSQVKLLFSANGFLDKRTMEGSIYEAVNNDGKWIAERRSTTYKHSLRPEVVNDETIVWLDFYPQLTFSEEEYRFYASSSRTEVIKHTESVTGADLKIATSAMLTALPKSVFILFFAFLWIVPPVLILMTLAFVNPKHIEKTSWKVRITSVVLLVISQYFVMSKINASVFNIAAPDYLTFAYSMLVYASVLGIVSFMVMMFVRTEDWSPSVEFIYIACINAWFISLLYGSYLL